MGVRTLRRGRHVSETILMRRVPPSLLFGFAYQGFGGSDGVLMRWSHGGQRSYKDYCPHHSTY